MLFRSRKMHRHLHHICTRSEQKGGPCGYWGIPRGAEHCEFCERGNPMRPNFNNNDGIYRFASDPDDEWATEDEGVQYTPTPIVPAPIEPDRGIPTSIHPSEIIPPEPGEKPKTVLPPHILEQIGDIQTFPEGWRRIPEAFDPDPSTLVGPVPSTEPVWVTAPSALDRVNCFSKHFNAHIQLFVQDRKSTRLNSSHVSESRMPSSA